MMITIGAYASVLGELASYFLALAVLLFGFATVICWAHYGMECVAYLSSSRVASHGFQLLYAGSVLLGTLWVSDGIWQVADLALGLMTLINLPVLCSMSGEVRRVTNVFLNRKNGLKKKRRRDIMRGRSSL